MKRKRGDTVTSHEDAKRTKPGTPVKTKDKGKDDSDDSDDSEYSDDSAGSTKVGDSSPPRRPASPDSVIIISD